MASAVNHCHFFRLMYSFPQPVDSSAVFNFSILAIQRDSFTPCGSMRMNYGEGIIQNQCKWLTPCLYPILTLWLVQLFLPFLSGVPGASLLTFTRASRDTTAYLALFSAFPMKLLPSISFCIGQRFTLAILATGVNFGQVLHDWGAGRQLYLGAICQRDLVYNILFQDSHSCPQVSRKLEIWCGVQTVIGWPIVFIRGTWPLQFLGKGANPAPPSPSPVVQNIKLPFFSRAPAFGLTPLQLFLAFPVHTNQTACQNQVMARLEPPEGKLELAHLQFEGLREKGQFQFPMIPTQENERKLESLVLGVMVGYSRKPEEFRIQPSITGK